MQLVSKKANKFHSEILSALKRNESELLNLGKDLFFKIHTQSKLIIVTESLISVLETQQRLYLLHNYGMNKANLIKRVKAFLAKIQN